MKYIGARLAAWSLVVLFFSPLIAIAAPVSLHFDNPGPLGSYPTQHAAAMIETSSNQLLACWWAGTAEGADDVQIFCRNRTADGTWLNTIPVISAETPVDGKAATNKKIGNVALGKDGEDRIWIFNSAVRKPFAGWSAASIDYRIVQDLTTLATSESHVLLGGLFRLGSMVRSSALTTSTGDLVLPYYSDLANDSGFLLIDHDSAAVQLFTIPKPSGSKGVIQPDLIYRDQEIFAYLRDKDSIATRLARFSLTTKKWAPVETTNIPNSNSPSAALILKNDVIVLLTNPNNGRPRYPLALMCSNDGINFSQAVEVEGPTMGSTAADYAYPSLVKTHNGEIHGLYSAYDKKAIRHFWLSEDDLIAACKSSLALRL